MYLKIDIVSIKYFVETVIFRHHQITKNILAIVPELTECFNQRLSSGLNNVNLNTY